jgi:hypothetical protein
VFLHKYSTRFNSAADLILINLSAFYSFTHSAHHSYYIPPRTKSFISPSSSYLLHSMPFQYFFLLFQPSRLLRACHTCFKFNPNLGCLCLQRTDHFSLRLNNESKDTLISFQYKREQTCTGITTAQPQLFVLLISSHLSIFPSSLSSSFNSTSELFIQKP